MKLYEDLVLEPSRLQYLMLCVQRLYIFSLRILFFLLRLPIIILAFFIESSYVDRRDPPPHIVRWILKVAYRNTPRVLVCMPFHKEHPESIPRPDFTSFRATAAR